MFFTRFHCLVVSPFRVGSSGLFSVALGHFRHGRWGMVVSLLYSTEDLFQQCLRFSQWIVDVRRFSQRLRSNRSISKKMLWCNYFEFTKRVSYEIPFLIGVTFLATVSPHCFVPAWVLQWRSLRKGCNIIVQYWRPVGTMSLLQSVACCWTMFQKCTVCFFLC